MTAVVTLQWLISCCTVKQSAGASGPCAGIYDCEASHPEKCGPAEGQQRYGQSYLCMTMNADELEKAAKLIQISEARSAALQCVWRAGSCMAGKERGCHMGRRMVACR